MIFPSSAAARLAAGASSRKSPHFHDAGPARAPCHSHSRKPPAENRPASLTDEDGRPGRGRPLIRLRRGGEKVERSPWGRNDWGSREKSEVRGQKAEEASLGQGKALRIYSRGLLGSAPRKVCRQERQRMPDAQLEGLHRCQASRGWKGVEIGQYQIAGWLIDPGFVRVLGRVVFVPRRWHIVR